MPVMMIGAIHLENHLADMKTMLERLLKKAQKKMLKSRVRVNRLLVNKEPREMVL